MTITDDDKLGALLAGRADMAGPTRAGRAQRCKFRRILDTVSPANRATLLNSPWSADRLAAVLRSSGHDVSGTVVGSHRRRECACSSFNLEPDDG